MNKKSITTSEQLLYELEKLMGTKGKLRETYIGLAKKIGHSFWTRSLTAKMDKLIADGRIELDRENKRGKFVITLRKPLTTAEKRIFDLNKSDEEQDTIVDPSYLDNYIPKGSLNVSGVASTTKVAAYTPQDNEDIDEIFDDFRNITRNLITKYQELQEENRKLEVLLENAKDREKKWMAQATLYRQQLLDK